MTRVYIDTEFTDFLNTELISIGCVAETGEEFYAELTDYRCSICSDFVKSVVVPLLDHTRYGMTRNQATAKLVGWLEELPQPITLVVDYNGDLDLFWGLVDGVESAIVVDSYINLNLEPTTVSSRLQLQYSWSDDERSSWYQRAVAEMRRVVQESRAKHGRQHHALEDARDNLKAARALQDFELKITY